MSSSVLFAPASSIYSVIWVAVVVLCTLSGAVLGAVLVNMIKTVFTAWLPEFLLYGLGLLFLVTTLFLPKGVMGLFGPARHQSVQDVTPEASSPEGAEA